MTGEIPPSLDALCSRLHNTLNQPVQPGTRGVSGIRCLSTRNRLLLGIIWMRRYPIESALAYMFGIDVSVACRILHEVIPILHQYLVPRFIRWPSNAEWQRRRNEIDHFPSAVGYLDGTCFRISCPVGRIQRLYYRGDKKFHFLNSIVIVDSRGFIVYSQPGFAGHLHDSTCYR